MELYRPVSTEEYLAIQEKDFRGFPPRKAQQQIFTTLLSEDGAIEIARCMRLDKRSQPTAYVVSFIVDDTYIRQFPVQQMEHPNRSALWIPSDEVDILNQHLIGTIQLVATYQLDGTEGDLFFA